MARVFTITEGLENMGALKTGGQGSVYKGRRIGQIITAVKLLPTPIHTEDPNDRNYRDFQNEVNKLKKVNEEPNPNVVKILTYGITESGSFPFIEMEYIEGPDLEDLLRPPHEPIFTIKEVIKVAEQLSNALAHCHKMDVRHGDIKSNNVKFNKNTANYILLDFGLAAMSDEQRRTSLRRAGAIEFMAPEQSEGELLFQSDVYSFGIILFELLAGIVPFPLTDKGESSRNQVMLAHLETAPPDLRELRSQHLPADWTEDKKNREMQVPEWLVSMIYRCLRKRPGERFSNGVELHDYILLNSTLNNSTTAWSADQVHYLRKQNEQLQKEKQQLQNTINRYQKEAAEKENEMQRLRSRPATQFVPSANVKRGIGAGTVILILVAILITTGLIYLLARNSEEKPVNTQVTKTITPPSQEDTILGQFKVAAAKAYFHNSPDESTRRATFLPKDDNVTALDEQNGFIYTEYTNSRGQVSKGWIKKSDLIPMELWKQQQQEAQQQQANVPPEQLYKAQLKQAKNFVYKNQLPQALSIYKTLVDQEVPEAMYEYADLTLHGKNDEIDCDRAFSLMEDASSKGYTPATSTLGFLYLFAENKAVLDINDYNHCEYKRNISKAIDLLKDATSKGDKAAKKLLDEYNQSNPQPQQNQ
jgi:eukaryotic-like serine/threonine-protein kinase